MATGGAGRIQMQAVWPHTYNKWPREDAGGRARPGRPSASSSAGEATPAEQRCVIRSGKQAGLESLMHLRYSQGKPL